MNDLLSKKNKSISCFYGNPKKVFSDLINNMMFKKYIRTEITHHIQLKEIVLLRVIWKIIK